MRYKGISYPLRKHPQGYFHNSTTDVEQIKANMAAVILTEPGERIFVPTFGTGLNRVNLNAPVEMASSEARIKVATSLKKWEKRVQVQDISVEFMQDEETKKIIVKVTVLFIDPTRVNHLESLTLYKSLGGSNGRNLPF